MVALTGNGGDALAEAAGLHELGIGRLHAVPAGKRVHVHDLDTRLDREAGVIDRAARRVLFGRICMNRHPPLAFVDRDLIQPAQFIV